MGQPGTTGLNEQEEEAEDEDASADVNVDSSTRRCHIGCFRGHSPNEFCISLSQPQCSNNNRSGREYSKAAAVTAAVADCPNDPRATGQQQTLLLSILSHSLSHLHSLGAGWLRSVYERDSNNTSSQAATVTMLLLPKCVRVRERQGCKPITVRLILGLVYN